MFKKELIKKFGENGSIIVYKVIDLSEIKSDDEVELDISTPVSFTKLDAFEIFANEKEIVKNMPIVLIGIAIEEDTFKNKITIPEEGIVSNNSCIIKIDLPETILSLMNSGELSYKLLPYNITDISYTENSTDTYKEIFSISIVSQSSGDTITLARD